MAISTPIRLTVASLLLALVFTLAHAGVLAAPAGAHPSGYCGHGQAGFSVTVTWVASWDDPYGGHWHKYEHRRFDFWRVHGDVWERC